MISTVSRKTPWEISVSIRNIHPQDSLKILQTFLGNTHDIILLGKVIDLYVPVLLLLCSSTLSQTFLPGILRNFSENLSVSIFSYYSKLIITLTTVKILFDFSTTSYPFHFMYYYYMTLLKRVADIIGYIFDAL